MTLLARIEKALEAAMVPKNGNIYSDGCNAGLSEAIERIRQEFAKPPTDEEVDQVMVEIVNADGEFKTTASIPHWGRHLARAAITADRGK